MIKRLFFGPILMCSVLGLSACANNFAVEGAGAGALAGAGIAGLAGGDLATGAIIGAAAGAAAGYFVDKNGSCDGWRNGRWDSDCKGMRGYPK